MNLLTLLVLLTAPWYQPPPEVKQAVLARIRQMYLPDFSGKRRPYTETVQFRDRQGVLWLTVRRVGDDVQEFNRDGLLVCHAWKAGGKIRLRWMDEAGRWHER